MGRKRGLGYVLDSDTFARLKATSDTCGLDKMAGFISENNQHYKMCKRPYNAALDMLSKQLGDANHRSWKRQHQAIAQCVEHFGVAVSNDTKPPSAMARFGAEQTSRPGSDNGSDKPITLNDLRLILPTLISETVKAMLPAHQAQQIAPVVKIRQREQIRKLVEQGNGGSYRSRWRLLYSTAEVRWSIDWDKLAAEHGIDAEDSGYRLNVAAKIGRLDDLLSVAEELFSEKAGAAAR